MEMVERCERQPDDNATPGGRSPGAQLPQTRPGGTVEGSSGGPGGVPDGRAVLDESRSGSAAVRFDLEGLVLGRTDGVDGEGMSIADAVAACAGERPRRPAGRPRCASPVLMEWMTTWADRLDHGDRQELRRYILPLGTSWGSDEQEIDRVWGVIDWLIRTDGPLWLRWAQLPDHADTLAALHEARNPEDLAEAYPRIQNASTAARDAADRSWLAVAEEAWPTAMAAWGRAGHLGSAPVVDLSTRDAGLWKSAEAHRLEAWAAVAETTTGALHRAATFVDCATNAAGYRTATSDEMPDGLRATTQAITNAARAIAWGAIGSACAQDMWCWETAPEVAAQVAGAALHSALRPVEDLARDSAHELIRRIL